MKTIKVIGLPGSGKSSMLRKLKKTYGSKMTVINEDLLQASDVACLHENPEQNGLAIQMKIIDFMISQATSADRSSDKLMLTFEHTPIEMVSFFTSLYTYNGIISDYGCEYLREKMNSLRQIEGPRNKTYYIYLFAPIHICRENIIERGRTGEDDWLDRDSLNFLHQMLSTHHDFCSDKKLVLHYERDNYHESVVENFMFEVLND